MDSYIVRIYRRAGRKPRILVGTVEPAGTRRMMAFTNIEDLWEILRRRLGREPGVPRYFQRRLRKEVMRGKDETDLEESSDGVCKT